MTFEAHGIAAERVPATPSHEPRAMAGGTPGCAGGVAAADTRTVTT